MVSRLSCQPLWREGGGGKSREMLRKSIRCVISCQLRKCELKYNVMYLPVSVSKYNEINKSIKIYLYIENSANVYMYMYLFVFLHYITPLAIGKVTLNINI